MSIGMTPERWQRIKEIFQAAVEQPAAERAALLNRACGDDPALKQEIETLLKFHEEAGDQLLSGPLTLAERLFASAAERQRADDESLLVALNSLVGTLLDRQYHIEALIGFGGMGAVYRARHALLHHSVAIKIISPRISRDQKYRQLFLREGEAATLFSHANAVTLHDLRETADGTIYMVLEYLPGQTLREELQQRGRFSPAEALAILQPIAEALQAAHERGVVHCDLKPGNIMIGISAAGKTVVKLLDLGVARFFTERDNAQTDSNANSDRLLGTPHYMAPEQAAGDAQLDRRADIYSLAVIFYELIAGHRPIAEAGSIPPLHKVVADLPKQFSYAIARALAKNRANRQTDCREFIDELQRALNPLTVNEAVKAGGQLSLGGFAGRSRRRWLTTIAILLIVLIMTGISISGGRPVDRIVSPNFSGVTNGSALPTAKPHDELSPSISWTPASRAFRSLESLSGYWEGQGSGRQSLALESGRQVNWRSDCEFWFMLDRTGRVVGEADIAYDAELEIDNLPTGHHIFKPESRGNHNDALRHFPIAGILNGSELLLELIIGDDQHEPIRFTLRAEPKVTGGELIIKKIERPPFSPFPGNGRLTQQTNGEQQISYNQQDHQTSFTWQAHQVTGKTRNANITPQVEAVWQRLQIKR